MITPSDIRVSVDVGCHRHHVAIGLPNGQVLDEFDMAHDPEGFTLFFQRIEDYQHRYGGAVSVAMEGYNGWGRPLDTLVRSHGYRLFNINNLKLARFKEIFPAAAKNDRIDARKGLELFQLGDHLPLGKGVLQEVVATPKANDVLKRLTRRRRALVEEKGRVLTRMQADLQAVCPGLLAITHDAENLWFLNFLSHADDLTHLARLRPKTVLNIPAVGRTYAGLIRTWQKQAHFSHEVAYVGPMIIEDARRVLTLRTTIKALERQCQALMAQSDMAQLIDSIPGYGVVCAAELAGELGTIDRFASEASLALYVGMAHLDHSSGRLHGSKNPKQVNTRAKAAMMVGVDRHRKMVPESQRYYEKKRAQAKTHNQAIRALGRHLCRVLFSMLKHGRPYELRENSASKINAKDS
jgi:transposase